MLINKAKGFTLLEIVIAIAIFALISSIVFPALMQFLEMRERVVEKHKQVIGLQKTFLFLANDLRYAANRLSKDEYGDVAKTTLSINGDSLLDFTALYPDLDLNGLNVPRRVRWVLEDGTLQRIQYPVMDPESDTRTMVQSLIDDVEEATVQVYEIEDGRSSTDDKWQNKKRLPNMVEVQLTLKNGVEYRRIFTMLGAEKN